MDEFTQNGYLIFVTVVVDINNSPISTVFPESSARSAAESHFFLELMSFPNLGTLQRARPKNTLLIRVFFSIYLLASEAPFAYVEVIKGDAPYHRQVSISFSSYLRLHSTHRS